MFPSKVVIAIVFLAVVVAEKKIELQDIEEDNLRNEKNYVKPEARSQQNSPNTPSSPHELLQNNLLRYYEGPTPTPQQPIYIQQYAVTEQPEHSVIAPKSEYGPPISQQSMLGYLTNMPVQFYLVPQYYNQPSEQEEHTQSGLQIPAPTVSQYQEPHQVQQQPQEGHQHAQQQVHSPANYIEIPAYVTPTTNSYIQPYPSPVTYISYSQPTAAPTQPNVTPVLAYQMPVVHYQNVITSPPPKSYYQTQQYTDSNTLNEVQDNEIENPKSFLNYQEVQPSKPPTSGYPRYYNSRIPVREEYRSKQTSKHAQLPHPNPLLLKAPPPHLSQIPKTLPSHRPINKPIYPHGGGFIPNAYTSRAPETFNSIPFKRRPTSLLDSYIPSSLQVEYLKRGLATDSLSAYEALASGRHLSQSQFIPRHYERGFLPNQMYHTAAGAISFGHHKRAPKGEKVHK